MAIYDTDVVHVCALPDCTAPTGTKCEKCPYWLTMDYETYEAWLDWYLNENEGVPCW